MSEIAAATGVSRPQLSKLRTNPTENTTIKTIEKLCIFFDCSLDDILEFDPPLKINK
ncbi:MAG: helix-turn-helix transcriptional regulator [Proteobacteria bacterium]|nr:helix-turn-helix transcriptional regulator [Pseudomonadota bacterium]MBU1586286.1 helix-turn-helix transcriptional regulator [Pseudomonadota bacterium]MBU2453182.1 helix-turn-helix transcriptional regulator [Pseudomonadota bacterium]MBU2630787.1 helix-turn-helix transcriptional regulator [Pseudomonadota bacterium]